MIIVKMTISNISRANIHHIETINGTSWVSDLLDLPGEILLTVETEYYYSGGEQDNYFDISQLIFYHE